MHAGDVNTMVTMRSLSVLLAAMFVAACGADDTPPEYDDAGAGADGGVDVDAASADIPAEAGDGDGGPDIADGDTGPRCGNGVIEEGEECDTGRVGEPQGSGCDACEIGHGWVCAGEPSVCERPCGNGRRDGDEGCDDGNRLSSDGCNNRCNIESEWACEGWPSVCERICGNGRIDEGEECDTGAASSGCLRCEVVPTWTCAGEPSVCDTTCGDGVIDPGEECDDGDTASPGCIGCSVTVGWTCAGSPSACVSLCGNGVLDSGEECDDGNLEEGDGCSSTCSLCGNGELGAGEACDSVPGCTSRCEVDVGWTCDATGACVPLPPGCGNGWLDGLATDWYASLWEDCDDGNTIDGDGCDARCMREAGWTCRGEPSVCEPDRATERDDSPCAIATGSSGGHEDNTPREWGVPCESASGVGHCDGRGACREGSACIELPNGATCDDGSGALDSRCVNGECVADDTWPCEDGVRWEGRCWPRARTWSYELTTSVSASGYLGGEDSWGEVSVASPTGHGERASVGYFEGEVVLSGDSGGCGLSADYATLGACTYACSSASVTASPARGRISGYDWRARIHASAYGYRESGPAPSAYAWAEISGFTIGECPHWACDTWAIVDGECVSTCDGVAECETAEAWLGPEWTNLDDDPANCGACGVTCTEDEACTDGICTCLWDTNTDPEHCGACGNACGEGASCVDGECECPFDTETDDANCGQCGNACGDRYSCVAGTCECDPDVVAENPSACDGCPDGYVGRYCELECPVGPYATGVCSGPTMGVCVLEDGEAVCDCYFSSGPDCWGDYELCTLENSIPW